MKGDLLVFLERRDGALLKKTALGAWHQQNDGKMVEFQGWSLPVNYRKGLIAEHLAVRKHGGLFDIGHMGRFLITGPDALEFLQHALTNSATNLALGQAQYTLISDHQGRPVDDAFLYRIRDDEYLLVVNAANKDKAWDWLSDLNRFGAGLTDVSLEMAMLAVQGPRSQELLDSLVVGHLPEPKRNSGAWCRLAGVEAFISRTGYTGEPVCFEVFVPWGEAPKVWQRLAETGAGLGITPAGLGARDTLRLEAGLPLYGHEYQPDLPIMAVPTARFGVDLGGEQRDFVGRAALATQVDEIENNKGKLMPRRVACVAALSPGMMRQGSLVLINDKPVGELTSGTMVPAWRFAEEAPGDESYNRAMGLALMDQDITPGTRVHIQYRNRILNGLVVKRFAKPVNGFLKPIEFSRKD